uniref:nucleobase-ascorbate transporter 4-like isoform X2 n=1 Tax=Fragaria vesca subsp. vesca TaxID=101020 RepID=UPI0005C9C5CB|nr:PREDICTED: nucleobase-ascorbate transporter 4-like isoform X2 [Fragaria vesca subsp. vesca]
MNLLFISGINTLVHAFYGTRLPVVIGSSFAYLILVISIADSKHGIPNPQRFEDTIREVQGSLLAASLLPIFLSLLPGLVRFIWRALDPITMIPMIIFTGFGLVNFGLPQLWSCPEIGGPSVLVVLFISQTLPFMVRCRAALLKHNKCFH